MFNNKFNPAWLCILYTIPYIFKGNIIIQICLDQKLENLVLHEVFTHGGENPSSFME